MAITISDGGATVTFDTTLEYVLWAFVLPFIVGTCTGILVTLYRPDLADPVIDAVIHAVVAAARLLKSLLVVPAAA